MAMAWKMLFALMAVTFAVAAGPKLLNVDVLMSDSDEVALAIDV